jgi:hypothetical protein
VYETSAAAAWFLGIDSKGVATTGDPCEWRATIRVKPDVKRVSGGYRVSFAAIPRGATIRATFDGSDPKAAPAVGTEVDTPKGATRLRVVAEVNGQFSQEEGAPLQTGVEETPREPLKPDAPAVMTSRFEPKDTAAAYSALDRLGKISGARVLGGTVELNGLRSEADFLTLRLGRDVPLAATDLDRVVKELAALLCWSAGIS